MTHRPGHLAPRMEGIGQAEFQGGPIEHVRLSGERNVGQALERRRCRVVVGIEVAPGPLLQQVQLRVAQGDVLSRRVDRGNVHRVAVLPGPWGRRPGVAREVPELIGDGPAHLYFFGSIPAQSGEPVGSGVVVRTSPPKCGGQAGVDPLQPGQPLEDRTDVGIERGTDWGEEHP